MQGKTLYTILLAIIAVLTLALAVMAIFLFTTLNANKTEPSEQSAAPAGERIVLPEEQAEFNLYAAGAEGDTTGKSGDAVFNIKSTEDHPNGFLMASISVVYDGGPKNELLEKRKTLFEKTYLSELKQATIEYFRSQSFEDLQAQDAMQKARDSLKDIYSKIVSEDPEEKIVLKIVFDKWIIQ